MNCVDDLLGNPGRRKPADDARFGTMSVDDGRFEVAKLPPKCDSSRQVVTNIDFATQRWNGRQRDDLRSPTS